MAETTPEGRAPLNHRTVDRGDPYSGDGDVPAELIDDPHVAERGVDPRATDPVTAIKEATHGRGPQLAIETSGATAAADAAVAALAP